jgi:MOSC domain-containing protein YiiM
VTEINQIRVASVNRSADYTFSKRSVDAITLVAGIGVEGDAHAGPKVMHRSRIKRDPDQPNLRQVHLIQSELFDEVAAAGFTVRAGELGENITTTGIDLLALPTGTTLRFGDRALVALTGLRNPCVQIDGFQDGLLGQLLERVGGRTVRRGGVMSVVLQGGEIRPGDPIEVGLPPGEPAPLEKV